ncbi:terminase [Verminephrobacter aporrectodeae subsp. tuberculatae]|uniref:terminase large subunit domain-containing protein n=1 Tax=Verminephrobacter aporrectodeae TaxID=1110389 RepID=UPI002244E821|nr:terminase family protein [Verminephrobacter aporrectodeae]MCW8207620.1 terminase [Verminephrobacter aporrectodeae subsp. tuberculatae]
MQAAVVSKPAERSKPDQGLNADKRRTARHLYWQGWRISSINEYLGEPRSTVQGWKDAEEWDKTQPAQRVEAALETRLVQLVMKEYKSGGDFKEIDLLGRQIERLARVQKYSETGKEVDLNPAIARRNEAPRKRSSKNHFDEEQHEKLLDVFRESLFDYQRLWRLNSEARTRFILKSRQIGATWYFAREALADAIATGRNQIFLSASKAQAHIFKQYIIAFAQDACGVELSGDPIVLSSGATLYFLGTNALTAQGYHGNFYFDECFWTRKFDELNKVASGMAMHKHWRKTYFSTPSSIQHDAYALWSGARFNRKRPKDDCITLDLSHERLAGGFTGEDRIWRQICTIVDAARGGCNLFDIEELRLEYSAQEFANLLMCGFLDDSHSMFPLADLQRCMVDSWDAWDDVKPFVLRPFGYRPVWVGYDPSHTGDTAGCIVLAPPSAPGGKFRVLEKQQFKGLDFEAQAEAIRKITIRFNVTNIGLDATGLGQGVYQLVKKFFPQARAYQYSVEVKTRLVLKATSVISKGRLEFDAGAVDLAQSFMAIKRVMTGSGRQATFDSGRNQDTGHADLAWACMHAMDFEPLEGDVLANRSIMEIS